MKKLIISKTLLFIFIVLFIAGFKSVFGDANTLIGVTTIIALLIYFERDVTANPWRNFFLLAGVNILQGVFGYLSAMNLWLALPLNFIAMFIVGYFFTFNLKTPLYIAFGLQYVFILATPVSASDLPLRLFALTSGAIIVMVAQLIIHKDKLVKAGNKHLLTICNLLIEKLNYISNNADCSESNNSIEKSIKELRKIIFHRRYDGYYFSHESRLKLKISACLEKTYLLFNRFEDVEQKTEVIAACKLELENVKQFIEKKSPRTRSDGALYELATKTNSLYINEVLYSFEVLYDLLEEAYGTDPKELKKVEKLMDIPTTFQSFYRHFAIFNRSSIRFTYAIRLGIIISLTAFIVDYLDLEQGKWIVFTVFSVTQPYSEHAKFRFRQRILGTFIGAVIFAILFYLFTDSTSRSLLILLFGYLNSYAVHYRNVVITVTFCALGSAALLSDPHTLIAIRMSYIILGVLLGLIANQLIFPHSIEKGTSTLVQSYKDTSKQLMEEVYHFFENKNNAHSINNLFAMTSFIEDLILLNNETMELKHSVHYLEKQRKLNNRIYNLFLRIQRKKMDHTTAKLIIEDIDRIMKSSIQESDQVIQQLRKESNYVVKMEDRIVVKDVLEIFEEFKHIYQYKIELEPRKV